MNHRESIYFAIKGGAGPEAHATPVYEYVNPGGVLDFGLDGGVPPGPRDPNPCLE